MAQKRKANKRCIFFAVLIAITAVLTLIFALYAYFVRHSIVVENVLSPAVSVDPSINEDFENGDTVKKNVNISIDEDKNRTEYPVYVRAKLVVTWQYTDEDNETIVYYTVPEIGKDYTITTNNTDWKLNNGDGYYYYQYIVPSGGSTKNLIEECEALRDFTDEFGKTYTLSVNIIAQTVQAVGYTDDDEKKAVEDAWGWEEPPTATSAVS